MGFLYWVHRDFLKYLGTKKYSHRSKKPKALACETRLEAFIDSYTWRNLRETSLVRP